MEYCDYVDLLKTQEPELGEELAPLQGMDGLLTWLNQRGLIPGTIDHIAQDEFEYDFMVHWKTEGKWLVFGIT